VRRTDFIRLLLIVFFALKIAAGQSTNGTISGIVFDPAGKAIPRAELLIVNDATGIPYPGATNSEGIYAIPNLPPGPYRIQVSKYGFKTLIKPDIVLHVEDALAINFTLPIGAASEIVTVEGGTPLLNTTDAAVSTVVDRQFAENLPMNGRSFQALIELTPGVVLTPSTQADAGQFSVNGQRSSSNYWMLDGVSANVGMGANFNAAGGAGGTLGAFSVLGGTNSLVSVDAMQEFRIQTSTYAPEFGRAPGGQISIVTRSGANRFSGTVFDFFRNEALDASNWFNGYTNNPPLPKSRERQNDFGGTFSGPILKDRTFFFFSYEGLRLRLPQTALTTVPDLNSRQNADPSVQPYLDAYPLPNGPDDAATGIAQFNSSYDNPATLDAYSLRLDHNLPHGLRLFARFNDSPSSLTERQSVGYALSVRQAIKIHTQTATAGLSWSANASTLNDFRANYSRTDAQNSYTLDTFGGAVPLNQSPFPAPYDSKNGFFTFYLIPLTNGALSEGEGGARNLQHQINLVDTLSIQKASHSLKGGIDYRRLTPLHAPASYAQTAVFLDVPSAMSGSPFVSVVESANSSTQVFQNLGVFFEDTWKIRPQLTVTYGVRWDVDFAPFAIQGPDLPAVVGYDLNDLSSLALAPSGTPPFRTRYSNVAPRIGVAYQIGPKPNWQSVLRGGFGVFYDLATSEAGGLLASTSYPFGAAKDIFGGSFPLDASSASPPPITVDQLATPGAILSAFDPNLNLPYTLQWNAALEQGIGAQQMLSVSYLGSVGRRLVQSANVTQPNEEFANVVLVGNTASSDYNALQVQFERRLQHGIQAIGSYALSHSIDDASAGSYANGANTLVPTINPEVNRGPSDFDIRNAISAGLTYQVPTLKGNILLRALADDWSLQSIVQVRSAPPASIYDGELATLLNGNTQVRPDLEPGIPLYLYGPQYPGGKAFNNTSDQGGPGCVGPFCPPPTDVNGAPLRQGDLGRNALRGFGAVQWDFALHREFPIHEAMKLQFRAEFFSLLNHPNFGSPNADISQSQFGLSTAMLGQSLNSGNLGGGGLSALYQIGGPRSIQLALKAFF
jgi:Carboxypeptidase regulatory-like domain/TonB dependent receptor